MKAKAEYPPASMWTRVPARPSGAGKRISRGLHQRVRPQVAPEDQEQGASGDPLVGKPRRDVTAGVHNTVRRNGGLNPALAEGPGSGEE